MLTKIIDQLILASEFTAITAYNFVGRGDEKAADRAAVEAMRTALNLIPFTGTIVIGEGERDEAPMLHIGEIVGSGGRNFDIAIDPLECTTNCSNGVGPSMSAIVIADNSMLLNAPDVYMEKIVVGNYPNVSKVIDLDQTIAENLKALSLLKGVLISDLTVAILKRERHNQLILEVLAAGARLHLISDGDISAAFMACLPEYNIDIYIGIGGAPEGVIAASAITMIGGHMQGRLLFDNNIQKSRTSAMLKDDIHKKYTATEMSNWHNEGDCCLILTGVTDGELLNGIKSYYGQIITESIVIYKILGSNTIRRKINTIHEKHFSL